MTLEVGSGTVHAVGEGVTVGLVKYKTEQMRDRLNREVQALYTDKKPSLSQLNQAIDNIMAHQNTAPFVSKQLIQHLVTSDPSPAYIARVSAAFRNNGAGLAGEHAVFDAAHPVGAAHHLDAAVLARGRVERDQA